MLSDGRIQYFLDTKYEDLKEGEYDELVKNYFQESKENWYDIEISELTTKELKSWRPNEVKTFWKLIRLHTKKEALKTKELNCRGFHFPRFEGVFNQLINNRAHKLVSGNFWESGEEISFYCEVEFSQAIFEGYGDFKNCFFYKNVSFTNSVFHDSFNFMNAKFYEDVSFSFVTFKKDCGINFSRAKFKKSCNFRITNFEGEANFTETSFSSADFSFCEFSSSTCFVRNIFDKEIDFNNTKFIKNELILFSDINQINESVLFVSNTFNENTIFRRVDMKNVCLSQSNIEIVKFEDCSWNEKGGRIVLLDEKKIPSTEEGKLGQLELIFRRLKKNFSNNKYWEQSAKAHFSEMLMRQKSLWKENSIFEWLIYGFYNMFGGTQDFKRPFFILFISTTLIFPLIYSDWCFLTSCEWDWNPLRKSIDAAIPLFKPSLEYKYWGIRYLQTFFSTILLTFFILALRKRFKQ